MIFIRKYKLRVANFNKTLNKGINIENLISQIFDKDLVSELSNYKSFKELNLWDVGVRATEYLEKKNTLVIIGGNDLYVGKIIDIIKDEKGVIGDAVGWARQYRNPWRNVILLTGLKRMDLKKNPKIKEVIDEAESTHINNFYKITESNEDKFLEILERSELYSSKGKYLKSRFSFPLTPREKEPIEKKPDIDDLLDRNESNRLERKPSFFKGPMEHKFDPVEQEFQICRTIAAFMNTDGGYLIIGQRDDKTIIGISMDLKQCSKKAWDEEDAFEREINDAIRKFLGCVEPQPDISFHLINGKKICIIKIHRSGKAVFFKPSSRKPLYNKIYNSYAKENSINLFEPKSEFCVRRGSSTIKIDDPKEYNDYTRQHFN